MFLILCLPCKFRLFGAHIVSLEHFLRMGGLIFFLTFLFNCIIMIMTDFLILFFFQPISVSTFLSPLKQLGDILVVIFHFWIFYRMAMQTENPQLPPSAEVVGNAFVEQYYYVLHRSPELVFRFYRDSSVMSWPDSNGLMSSVTTMQVSFLEWPSFGLLMSFLNWIYVTLLVSYNKDLWEQKIKYIWKNISLIVHLFNFGGQNVKALIVWKTIWAL